MTRPRRLRWGVPEQPLPKHPYRDTLILYGVFAALIVLVAWLTGGGVGYGYATFTGHATYIGALAGVPFAGTTVVDLTIPWG